MTGKPQYLFALLILTWSQPSWASEIVALISAESAPLHAPQFEADLVGALATAKLKEVLTPAQFRARLTRAEEIAAKLHQSTTLLQAADQALLNMDRSLAIRTARECLTYLRQVNALYHSPELIARAQNTLALALLFQPADSIGALQAYRAAVEAVPGFQPDMDRTPPRALKLLEQAQRDPRMVQAPTAEELNWLARKADADRLIWIIARAKGQAVKLELLIYSAREEAITTHLHKEVEVAQMAQTGAALIQDAIHPPVLATQVPHSSTPILAAVTKPAAPEEQKAAGPMPQPWYKKWWFWTIAGAVVSGTTIALAVGLSKGETPTPTNPYPDFIFRF